MAKKKQRGKKYLEVKKKVNTKKELPIEEAVKLVKETSYSKFPGKIELKVNVNVDPKDSEQNVRFTTELPHPIPGKKKKVLVFTNEKIEQKDYPNLELTLGDETVIEQIKKGEMDVSEFDKVVAEPSYMPKIAQIAQILGPKGLMPSPKSNTVGAPKKILTSLNKGQVEVRTQPGNKVIHLVVGSVESKDADIVENIKHLIEEINKNRPAKVKKKFMESAYISATMSPSVKIVIE
ncbi:MAG TPA: 50S ribosomal protein L1 [candidate division WWE3 bacterium]|uniref:Ribosomal protein n=1 Tax=candidate division WWE3 bacterium TaxID=2053526 RepID=A0A7V5J2N1_UNCKA|nr:50S ribosomal protein L1 [candidate division WWE3 bacterium]